MMIQRVWTAFLFGALVLGLVQDLCLSRRIGREGFGLMLVESVFHYSMLDGSQCYI